MDELTTLCRTRGKDCVARVLHVPEHLSSDGTKHLLIAYLRDYFSIHVFYYPEGRGRYSNVSYRLFMPQCDDFLRFFVDVESLFMCCK